MTDLHKLVAAIERQKPEILSVPEWMETYARTDSELRPLLLGLLVEWASERDLGLVVSYRNRAGKHFAQRYERTMGQEHDDLLAAWAWVCGVEVGDE